MRCDVPSTVLPEVDDAGLDAGTACPVDQARRQLAAVAASTCGRDVFCREGSRQIATILTDVSEGRASSSDADLVDELARLLEATAACPLVVSAAHRVLTLLRDHADEWDRHLRRRRCTSLSCRTAFTLYVSPDTCTGCGDCVPACPRNAVRGGEGLIHVVDVEACDKCLACIPACPNGSVRKAGPVRPKLPPAPVPVGSFATTGTAAGGMTRRRRRGG